MRRHCCTSSFFHLGKCEAVLYFNDKFFIRYHQLFFEAIICNNCYCSFFFNANWVSKIIAYVTPFATLYLKQTEQYSLLGQPEKIWSVNSKKILRLELRELWRPEVNEKQFSELSLFLTKFFMVLMKRAICRNAIKAYWELCGFRNFF